MNIVFFKSWEELDSAKSFFPEDDFVIARFIRSEKELVQFKNNTDFKQKKMVVLEKSDSNLFFKAKQSGFLTGILGVNPQACMFCVQQKTDFLLQPFSFSKPSWDLSVLQVANQKKVKIGLFFSDVLNASVTEKIRWFQNAFFLAQTCKKKKVQFFVFSGAGLFSDCRSEKDLKSFAELLETGF